MKSDSIHPFGSDFLFQNPLEFGGESNRVDRIDLQPSFAQGGLSNSWGGSVSDVVFSREPPASAEQQDFRKTAAHPQRRDDD